VKKDRTALAAAVRNKLREGDGERANRARANVPHDHTELGRARRRRQIAERIAF